MDRLKENGRRSLLWAAVAVILFGLAYGWNSYNIGEDKPATAEPAEILTKAALPDTEIGRAVTTLLEHGEFQRDLPESPKPRARQQTGGMPAWLGKAILYSLMGLGLFAIAVFVWVLVTGNPPKAPRKKHATTRRSPNPKQHRAEHAFIQHATFDDAERAAENGNFGEAIRILLALSLLALAEQRRVLVRPHMTGREIVDSASLDSKHLAALRFMVLAVETYAFAGRDITESVFSSCLGGYRSLTEKNAGQP
ncbi:hypothetical protein [Kordiimonas aestuarii]|uniref:hypothetical protein n=1 Tax=Kordiimonas aestuarii TaxID=1005925 RepID=UPI0021CEB8B5|nr:hypothetical protein [Kordiimonas aestuarii]